LQIHREKKEEIIKLMRLYAAINCEFNELSAIEKKKFLKVGKGTVNKMVKRAKKRIKIKKKAT